jgi:hypothetical protein
VETFQVYTGVRCLKPVFHSTTRMCNDPIDIHVLHMNCMLTHNLSHLNHNMHMNCMLTHNLSRYINNMHVLFVCHVCLFAYDLSCSHIPCQKYLKNLPEKQSWACSGHAQPFGENMLWSPCVSELSQVQVDR